MTKGFRNPSIQAVTRHYAIESLTDRILEALKQSGKTLEALTPDDTAPLDEFHIRGREATRILAKKAGVLSHHHVLDVGCGIGGASRFLATTTGCRVTGIDLTQEYCEAATLLADLMGLSEQVAYQQGNALDLPFEDHRFDVVWTQHASMNIQDKRRLFSEMYRVLKPGGTLALYDIAQGENGPPYFPVPWANHEAISFLATPGQTQELLASVGFEVKVWEDLTEQAQEWFAGIQPRLKTSQPPLGLHLLLGSAFPILFENMGQSLMEGRIRVVQGVLVRA